MVESRVRRQCCMVMFVSVFWGIIISVCFRVVVQICFCVVAYSVRFNVTWPRFVYAFKILDTLVGAYRTC